MTPERLKYLNELSEKIIGAAMAVHSELGPGLLESVYEVCLTEEFDRRGIHYQQQVDFPVYYKDILTNKHLRMDLVVEDSIIVELKAVEKLIPIHEVQLLTYLKLTEKNLGLLINFNVPSMKLGIKRKIFDKNYEKIKL